MIQAAIVNQKNLLKELTNKTTKKYGNGSKKNFLESRIEPMQRVQRYIGVMRPVVEVMMLMAEDMPQKVKLPC